MASPDAVTIFISYRADAPEVSVVESVLSSLLSDAEEESAV